VTNAQGVSILTIGVIPIPVGHRIEARFYDESDAYASRRESPVIIDLDTGIVYGHHWHFADINGASVGDPMSLPATVRAELPTVRRVVGRVTATQVTWTVIHHPCPQTMLHIEPMSDEQQG
jgi:hypothetical protein